MDQELILNQLQENAELIQNGFALVESHLINIEAGLQIMLYVAIAFFVWAVIRVLYKLFGGIFFGGV